MRASWRGETAWAREGVRLRTAGPSGGKLSASGLTLFEHFLTLYVWVLSVFAKLLNTWRPDVSAFCMGFEVFRRVLIADLLLYVWF